MRLSYCLRFRIIVAAISLRTPPLCCLLFLAVAPGTGQDDGDYRAFGACAGYFSKELQVTKSSASALRAESEWYNAKVGPLPVSPLKRSNDADLGAQLYALDEERSGGPPIHQVWLARRHTECAEIAIKLFPAEANCFEKSGEYLLFVCQSPRDNSSANHEGPRGRPLGTASPQNIQPSSPSAVYEEFLKFRKKGEWSKMFAMFDPDSQHRAAEQIRQTVSTAAPEIAAQASSMSDEEIFVLVLKTGNKWGEIKLISEHITGDVAVLDTKVRKNNTWYDADPKVELHRINGKWMMYWPQ